MSILQAIVLGAIQGITEFLPVSSSGHLIAFPTLFGWEQQGVDFDVMIHLGTLLAIVWVMRKDALLIIKDSKMLTMMVIGTIPIALLGVLMGYDVISVERSVSIVAISLLFWGIVLWVADMYSERLEKHISKLEETRFGHIIVIGCAQALALIPGTSRSGITITAGLFAGLDRRLAARISFLLAIPAILGAGAFTMMDAVAIGFTTSTISLVAGFFSSAIFGAIAIHFLLKIIQKMSYKWFAIYR